MIRLEAREIGRRFHRQWVFRSVSFTLSTGDRLLVTGSNGAGKSTLMRILSGQLSPSKGSISLFKDEKQVDPENWYHHLSWSGPYMDIYPDLTLEEIFGLQFKFKESLLSIDDAIEKLGLKAHRHKELRHFSSGMLHRVKVGLAIFSTSHLLLLDEATTNMDEANSKLIWSLVQEFQQDRILIWASNRSEEFDWFESQLELV